MKNIIRNVISKKSYELSDMLKKIDTLWIQGSFSDEEKEELISLARENAEVQQSIDVLLKLEELDKRIKALEDAKGNNPGEDAKEEPKEEGEEEGEEETEEITYDEYVVGKWYYNGDVVMFEGKAYECIAPDGQVCTWSPSEYPVYWGLLND